MPCTHRGADRVCLAACCTLYAKQRCKLNAATHQCKKLRLARCRTQTQEEIDRYTVEEGLPDVERAVFLLKKGDAAQRSSTLAGLASQLFKTPPAGSTTGAEGGPAFNSNNAGAPAALGRPRLGATGTPAAGGAGGVSGSGSGGGSGSGTVYTAAFDKVYPALQALLTAQDTPAVEKQACVQALADVACTRLLAPSTTSGRIVTLLLRACGRGEADDVVTSAAEAVALIVEAGGLTHDAAAADVIPAVLTLGGVSNTPIQRAACCRILVAIVASGTLPCREVARSFFEPLMALCQDVEASVRCLMARLLAPVMRAVAMAGASTSGGGGGGGSAVVVAGSDGASGTPAWLQPTPSLHMRGGSAATVTAQAWVVQVATPQRLHSRRRRPPQQPC
jgi:hypothetical protein